MLHSVHTSIWEKQHLLKSHGIFDFANYIFQSNAIGFVVINLIGTLEGINHDSQERAYLFVVVVDSQESFSIKWHDREPVVS